MTDAVDAGETDALGQEPIAADVGAAPIEGATTAAAPASGDQSQKPSIEDTIGHAWDKLNPKRDGHGRFAAQTADGAKDSTELSADQPKEAAAEPVPPAIAPPVSWSAEMKAKWASLPPDAQTYIAQRDKEAHDSISRMGTVLKNYEPIGHVLQQFAETFQRNRLHPADAIGRLLDVESRLATDPAGTLKDIAKAYNVDISRLSTETHGQGEAQEEQGTPSPEVSTLKSALAQTQAQLGQVMSYLSAQQRAQLQSDEAAINQRIADFSKDKPHFEAVRSIMGALMTAEPDLTLDDAYERATYAVPTIRQAILAQQQKAKEEAATKEAQKKAADARKSAATNVKSSVTKGGTPRTWEDTLSETADRLFAQ